MLCDRGEEDEEGHVYGLVIATALTAVFSGLQVGRAKGLELNGGSSARFRVDFVVHPWSWARLAARLQADQPPLARKVWGFAVRASRMIPDPSS